MAGWRRVIGLTITDEEIERLKALSRSRTEPASRVSRAQMLLAYRENPSFCAVGQRVGVHHQTVQRCVERALAYGPLAAIEDRPRPGKEPVITPDAKAWLVSLACDKAKEHGYPHELWTTRLLAHHARERGPMAGHECLANLVQGTVCKILGQEEIKPHKVRYYLERRDAEFEQKMAEVLCVYREVQVLKRAAAKAAKPSSEWRSSPTTKSRESRRSQRRHPICRPSPASTRPSRGITSTNVMARLACWPEFDLLTGKVYALAVHRHRQPGVHPVPRMARRCSTSRLLPDRRFDPPIITPRTYREKQEPGLDARPPGRFEFTFTPTHGSWLNLIEGFFSKLARSVLRHIRVTSKHELKERIMAGIDDVNRHPVIHTWSYKLADAA